MELIQDKINRYNALMRSIRDSNKFGVKCDHEKSQLEAIKTEITEISQNHFDKDYIQTHKWEKKHIEYIEPWDIVIFKNRACRIKEIIATDYNEGSDTFSYKAVLLILYTGETQSENFNYYDMLSVLV